jgi:hypothetical protein
MTEEARRKNGHATGVGIEDVVASAVETKAVEWLWNRRIPKGKLTMFDGDPDLGKSVVTMDIVARKSTGRPFPDGAPCEAGNVLVCNVEDGQDDTIVPRLKAHGADLDRVFLFTTVPNEDGGKRLLELPRDIVLLENKVRQREAALLIIDPVLTMLGGDANKDQDARKALTPIKEMAERTGVAVVCVRHLNKSVGLKAIQRGGGNMGLIGVARAGSLFARHPDDERLRVMAPLKSNLAAKPPSLKYRIVSSIAHDTARVEWAGTTDHDADSLAADSGTPQERSELDGAKEFLHKELGGGWEWAKVVFRDAEQAGVSRRTLYRAKDALRVRSEKLGTEGWIWALPTVDGPPSTRPRGGEGGQAGNVGNVGNVGSVPLTAPENQAYLREGGQDCQDGQGGQGGHGGPEGGHVRSVAAHVRRLLDDPPLWLVKQLPKCANEPDRYLGATAVSVATEARGGGQPTAEELEEARRALEDYLGLQRLP